MPNLTFYLDTDDDGGTDTTVSAWPMNDGLADTWMRVDQNTIKNYHGAYVVWAGSSPRYKFSWNAVLSDYGTADLLGIKIGKGVIGTNESITTYVDDFTMSFNGTSRTWVFEGEGAVPEPLTMFGVLIGLGGLAGYVRKRKKV